MEKVLAEGYRLNKKRFLRRLIFILLRLLLRVLRPPFFLSLLLLLLLDLLPELFLDLSRLVSGKFFRSISTYQNS